MTIEAIFFDAGNTLIFIDPKTVIPILEGHGASVGVETFREAEFQARAQLTRRVEEGAFGTEDHIWSEYMQTLFRACGVSEDRLEEVGKKVIDIFYERHLWTFMDPTAPDALDQLRDAGYRLAVISNADGRVEGLIEGVGIRDRFEFVMDSAIEGVEKPDPEIFLRACRRMGVDPGRAVYVGDLYPVDCLGSQAVGMHPVLMDPLDRLDYPVDRIPDIGALPPLVEQLSHRP